MPRSITVFLNDGGKEVFTREFRAGGSWDISYKIEGEFVIISDVYGKETIFHGPDIAKVETEPDVRF